MTIHGAERRDDSGGWPNLIVAGTQKAGTTWLHRALDAHPEVTMSSPKELYFWGKPEVDDPDRRNWYRRHFTAPSRYLGESTSNYFWRRSPEQRWSPPRNNGHDPADDIARVLGTDVHVFALMRSPVERAIAGANHHLTMGRIAPADDVLDLEAGLGVIDLGFYARHLEHWRSVFGEQVHPLFFDDVRDRPGSVLAEVFGVLGLDATLIDPDVRREIEQPTHTRSEIRASRAVDASAAFEVDANSVGRLVDVYLDDIERLSTATGRDLSAWTDVEALQARLVNFEALR